MAHRAFQTEEERQQFYSDINAAAETGMDFTSRWFIANGTNNGELRDVRARSIIPVELNAIMHYNAKVLAEYHLKLGNTNIATKYEYKAKKILEVSQMKFQQLSMNDK